MSWLSDRLSAGGATRPFPVGPLAGRLGIRADDPELVARLAVRLDLNAGWVRRCRALGLTLAQADEWATRAGLHPAEVWASWMSDLRGIALVNANRTHCLCGRRYDRVDSLGRRRCSLCWYAAMNRLNKIRKAQVARVLVLRRTGARHLWQRMTVMDTEEPTGTDWLTVQEVADLLRVHTDAVYGACARGELAHVRVGRVIRVSRSALIPTTAPRVAS